MKYVRVYSDNFDGHVFTEQAFNVLKTQLCNGDTSMFETKQVTASQISVNEKIHGLADLIELGYSVPDDVGNEDSESLTQQSDDEFLDSVEDENELEFQDGYEDDEGYF
jgi:hypothetical protein